MNSSRRKDSREERERENCVMWESVTPNNLVTFYSFYLKGKKIVVVKSNQGGGINTWIRKMSLSLTWNMFPSSFWLILTLFNLQLWKATCCVVKYQLVKLKTLADRLPAQISLPHFDARGSWLELNVKR